MIEKLNVRVPLFDRLRGGEGGTIGEFAVPRSLDRAGLVESVRRELEQLFNTRCQLPAEELDDRERTVVDYGIPDFSHLSPLRDRDRDRLVASLKQAIYAYEPRLSHIEVHLGRFTKETQSFELRIDAMLIVDNVRESVSFRSVLPTTEGKANVVSDSEPG